MSRIRVCINTVTQRQELIQRSQLWLKSELFFSNCQKRTDWIWVSVFSFCKITSIELITLEDLIGFYLWTVPILIFDGFLCLQVQWLTYKLHFYRCLRRTSDFLFKDFFFQLWWAFRAWPWYEERWRIMARHGF